MCCLVIVHCHQWALSQSSPRVLFVALLSEFDPFAVIEFRSKRSCLRFDLRTSRVPNSLFKRVRVYERSYVRESSGNVE